MHHVARDLGVKLDSYLSCVDVSYDGTVSIVASTSEFPRTTDERDMTRSGLHVALMHEFMDVPRLNICVIVPEALPTSSESMLPVNDWIRAQDASVVDFVNGAKVSMIRAACVRIIDAFPWRERDRMILRVPHLLRLVVADTNDLFVDTLDAIDHLLPSAHAYICESDLEVVVNEVEAFLGRPASTLIEMYECIHHMVIVSQAITGGAMHTLAHNLFVTKRRF